MNPPPNDPNGYDYTTEYAERGYESPEAMIDAKSGACPQPHPTDAPDDSEWFQWAIGGGWPDPPKDDRSEDEHSEWPQRKPPPYAADDEDDVIPHD